MSITYYTRQHAYVHISMRKHVHTHLTAAGVGFAGHHPRHTRIASCSSSRCRAASTSTSTTTGCRWLCRRGSGSLSCHRGTAPYKHTLHIGRYPARYRLHVLLFALQHNAHLIIHCVRTVQHYAHTVPCTRFGQRARIQVTASLTAAHIR